MTIPASPRAAHESSVRACPECGESILTIARKCKHCGTWFETGTANAPSPNVPPRRDVVVGRTMSFGEAVASCFGQYATFLGRAPRAEYWYWQLFTMLVGLAAAILSILVLASNPESEVLGNAIMVIVQLPLWIPTWAVLVRRLHDTNRSGWWWLIALTIIGVIPLLIWFCEAGTDGENRYGPNPYHRRARGSR